jgi:hypothetical protein
MSPDALLHSSRRNFGIHVVSINAALLLLLMLVPQPLLAQTFAPVSPPWSATMTAHQRVPYRQIGSDPWVKFILSSAKMYSVSSNMMDNCSAIIPLYTDYNAGGAYGLPDAITNVTVDDNDSDAADGTSSYAMTWNGQGVNGYFQFDIGCNVPNSPRTAANFGLARQVRFSAKGDIAGREVELLVFERNACNGASFASAWFSLTNSWRDYGLDISSFGLTPQQLHAVQFLMNSSMDSGGGTVLLDDVRIDTDAYDPLRGIQSYIAKWADKNSDPNSPAGRDANIYPNRSYLYDNALAIKALLAGGYPSVAMNIADGRMATAADCTNGFPNELNSGHTLLVDGSPRAPFSQRKRLGDNAWFGLALLDLYNSIKQTKYLTCAQQISNWAENDLKYTTGALQGYTGGWDDNNTKLGSRSTEENADLFLLNSELGQPYSNRAPWAATFALAMYDSAGGKFWAGTSMGDTINTASIPLDAQTLPFLTLGLSAQYHNATNYVGAITWAENNLVVTDNGFTGFTYSSNSKSQSSRVWFEGTAQVCLAYEILGQLEPVSLTPWGAKAAACRQTLQNASSSSGGIIVASSDNLVDTVLNQFYDARQGIAPTSWAVFVRSLQGIR